MQSRRQFQSNRAPQNQPVAPAASARFFEPNQPQEIEKSAISPKMSAPDAPKNYCPFPQKGPLAEGDFGATVPFYVRNHRPTLREFEIW